MTHSLHRCGSLQEQDYVWLLYHVKGVNDDNLTERMRQALAIAEDAGSINWGDVKSGPIVNLSEDEVKAKLTDKSRLRGVFASEAQVTQFLSGMKAADLGLCVIITGPLQNVYHACRTAGLTPHTINYSIGVFGKKEAIADEQTLAITTMCGHHMIPDRYVARVRSKVRRGKTRAEKAALKMAKMCPCGIFNQQRAAALLASEIETSSSKES
jgi:hypothetical protein